MLEAFDVRSLHGIKTVITLNIITYVALSILGRLYFPQKGLFTRAQLPMVTQAGVRRICLLKSSNLEGLI